MGKTYRVACVDHRSYGGDFAYRLISGRMEEPDEHERLRFRSMSELRVYAAANALSVDESAVIPVKTMV